MYPRGPTVRVPPIRRNSWWEEAERFRDLDEIVELSPSGMGKAARWLLIGAVGSCACAVGWYGMDRDGRQPALPLAKFDQVLARHAEQRVHDGATKATLPDRQRSDSSSAAAPSRPAEPAQPLLVAPDGARLELAF